MEYNVSSKAVFSADKIFLTSNCPQINILLICKLWLNPTYITLSSIFKNLTQENRPIICHTRFVPFCKVVLLMRLLNDQRQYVCTVITNIASWVTNSRLHIVEYVSTTEAAQTFWLAVANTVMKLWVPWGEGNLLISLMSISFSTDRISKCS